MNVVPSNQKNLFEHEKLLETLYELYKKGDLPNKILFSGEKGIGKATLAYHLINAIQSENEEYSYNKKNFQINPNNKSFKLIQNKSNPNFYLIDTIEKKNNIDIEQIRELIFNLNKSSFNNNPRFVLIDNIELLNSNSINALLKTLEEPNHGINFILINNNKKITPTLKSRCLNFKIVLTFNQSLKVVNQIFEDNVYNIVNEELINYYLTPGQLLKIIEFSQYNSIDIKNIVLKDFLKIIIKDKIYKKDKSFNELIYSYIELYFRKNISVNKINLLDSYRIFVKKISDLKVYNLDEETFFIEFEEKILNG